MRLYASTAVVGVPYPGYKTKNQQRPCTSYTVCISGVTLHNASG